ncbi:hypothetical protein HG537_0G01280 [Torulaspora globosa]|uniref:C3H1-type domain-containing protein n=1 Tax=Torulaspora globosa TaxID=48254 RepID=A0A7H9HVX5_9SACH|nr:hypothetical protein HG537_0G01280 [Torulaspora sp. CBS 2947]
MGSPRQDSNHYHGRHRRPCKGKKTSEPITTGVFSPQQQKAIIEHQLITKNHIGQKTYAHVPCKFFKQGTCQAGDSCPFSHSLDASAADQTPCEYFRRGNCKFGSRCANAHVLPGNRVEQAVIDEDDEEDGYFPHDEEFYIPADFAELLAPERIDRRNSGSSSTTAFSSIAPSSAASSYTATAASPLLQQQLAYLQPSAKSFTPWSPPPNSRNSFSWLLGDLARLRIDEEEPLVYTDYYDATNTANIQDTQFLFDDLPDNFRF